MGWNSIKAKDAPVGNARTSFLRWSLLAATAVGLALAVTTTGPPSVSADNDGPKACSNRTLRGDYGYAFDGSIVPPSPTPSILLRGLVMRHFDGHGNFSQVDFVTLNGIPAGSDWRPGTGTYEVNPDCTGAAVINFDDGSPSLHLRYVVVDGGRQVMESVEGTATGSVGLRVR